MRIIADGGRILDVTFNVTEDRRFQVSYESSGGSADGPNPRNLDYRKGLTILIQRLAALQFTLVEILVDTERTAGLTRSQRSIWPTGYPLPLKLTMVTDADDLRRAISVAARKVGQTPEQAARSGGSSRRLLFAVQAEGGTKVTLDLVVDGLVRRTIPTHHGGSRGPS
jgi:hypothetical protein